jgi:alkylation response protein AidB-like acyl-CoA dehydrogenase
MDFRDVTDRLMECGVTLPMIAQAAGVSENSISRARFNTGQRRSPPKEWQQIARRLAELVADVRDSEAFKLRQLAAELADA